MKRNKYKLSKKSEAAVHGKLIDVVATYNIDSDSLKITVGIREDFKDSAKASELMLRVGRQVENAMRTILPPYHAELLKLEQLAKVVDSAEEFQKDNPFATIS